MPRGRQKIGTAAEVEAMREAVEYGLFAGQGWAKPLESLYDKITAPRAPAIPTAEARAIEAALVASAFGKVLAVDARNDVWWYPIAKRFGAMGATAAQAAEVGAWLSRQRWLTAPMTVDQVARGWPSYLARSRAAAPEVAGAERTEFDG